MQLWQENVGFLYMFLFQKVYFFTLIFSGEMDSEPPIKKPKSNGSMKDEKPFITDSPTDTSEEVKIEPKPTVRPAKT